MQAVQTENEQKKEYLKGYRTHVRRINRIETELAELRAMRISMSMNNDGMPHGSGQADLSSYVAELDRQERNLIKERHERIKTYEDIVSRIKKLKSENEKDVLFYRYISGLAWWEIAEKMSFSERHVTRLHGKALAHLEIAKDVLECPSDM
jgi:DNA-directed RNA polymerase specialized sigma subunit